MKHKYQKGFKQRWSDIEISLLLADPFRYATASTLRKTVFEELQSGTEISIHSEASVDVPLIFTFRPFEGQSMPDISIVHVESGESFRLRDTLLTAPAAAVVNGETGTVRRGPANSLNTFQGCSYTLPRDEIHTNIPGQLAKLIYSLLKGGLYE